MFIKNNISSYCGERFCHHEACGFDWNWLNSCWIGSDTHISFRMNFNHSGNPLSFNAVPSSGQHLNVLNILVCLCYSQTQHYLNDGGMKRMSSGVSQHEEWRWSVVWWYGSRCFCIASQPQNNWLFQHIWCWPGNWALSCCQLLITKTYNYENENYDYHQTESVSFRSTCDLRVWMVMLL